LDDFDGHFLFPGLLYFKVGTAVPAAARHRVENGQTTRKAMNR
jgi:hypothetical protein